MARAIVCALALGAVDETDVVPKLVAVDNAVLKLRVFTSRNGVGLADLEGSVAASGATGFAMLSASGDLDHVGCCHANAGALHVDVVVAAVGNDGVAGDGKAGLQGRDKEGGFGEHCNDCDVECVVCG